MLSRVEAAMVPIECAPHDIFEPTHQPFWEATALQFEAELKSLDLELGQFLDDSFTKLRFAKETFKLLEKWRAVQSGDANAEELIARKTRGVLEQYDKELAYTRREFDAKRESPPLSKNMPPVAGAIQWSHGLFRRIRETIGLFQGREELASTEEGRQVARHFVEMAKEIHEYEGGLFEQWTHAVQVAATELLKQRILRAEVDGKPVEWRATASLTPHFTRMARPMLDPPQPNPQPATPPPPSPPPPPPSPPTPTPTPFDPPPPPSSTCQRFPIVDPPHLPSPHVSAPPPSPSDARLGPLGQL